MKKYSIFRCPIGLFVIVASDATGKRSRISGHWNEPFFTFPFVLNEHPELNDRSLSECTLIAEVHSEQEFMELYPEYYV